MNKKSKTGRSFLEKKKDKLKAMVGYIDHLITSVKKKEKQYKKELKKIHPENIKSAKNLIHYRALRNKDISALQKMLGNLGLSRMAEAQGSVMSRLQSSKVMLLAMLGKEAQSFRSGLSIKKAMQLSKKNAKTLLGYRSKGRHTRIMVTLPSEASWNYKLVENMILNGMNCARINCAHDDEELWLKMIENIRKASKKLKKRCKISMDLAGPKIRTGPLVPGPKVQKLRPNKDVRGKINKALDLWIGTLEDRGQLSPFIPVTQTDFELIKKETKLYFLDARDKKRSIEIHELEGQLWRASIAKTAYLETGMKLFFNKSKTNEFVTVGELRPLEVPILLNKGDYLLIKRIPILGQAIQHNTDGSIRKIANISCTAPEIFEDVKIGEPILFDDGKIQGVIEDLQKEDVLVNISRTLDGGSKLRADKGINLPKSDLKMDGLTKKDVQDLKFVIKHADVVNLSFVNSKEDVQKLFSQLQEFNANPDLGIILKIETQKGFNNLTNIILKAMQFKTIGVMIARGDLAIEVGWGNIGRVQQEILALCEAAHITDIWATQVLETLAKSGIPSRAEITDVIKSQQSDCVMLNKGPFIIDSINLLDNILKDMDPFREKSSKLTPAMKKAAPVGV
jgi:pyruvate kinase